MRWVEESSEWNQGLHSRLGPRYSHFSFAALSDWRGSLSDWRGPLYRNIGRQELQIPSQSSCLQWPYICPAEYSKMKSCNYEVVTVNVAVM